MCLILTPSSICLKSWFLYMILVRKLSDYFLSYNVFLALVDSLKGKKKLNFHFFSLFMKMPLMSPFVIFGMTINIHI